MFAGLKFSAIESSFPRQSPADRLYAVSHGAYTDPHSLCLSLWRNDRKLNGGVCLPARHPVRSSPLWWMRVGPSLPHIHLTLLTQYKMWWLSLPHCRDPGCSIVIYSHSHEKVSLPLKSQVFGGHTTHQSRSIMSFFYMAHSESAAASYAISEALIYWGANLCLPLELPVCKDTRHMDTYSCTHTCIHCCGACVYSVSTCTHTLFNWANVGDNVQ